MLELANTDETVHLKCEVLGYQFPDAERDDWCMIRVQIRQGDASFEGVDPALEAIDLPSIRDWLMCLKNGRLPRWAHLTFTEPCLGLEFLAREQTGVRIAVHLGGALRPPFPLEWLGMAWDSWQVVAVLDRDELGAMVAGVERTMSQFPVRSGRVRGDGHGSG